MANSPDTVQRELYLRMLQLIPASKKSKNGHVFQTFCCVFSSNTKDVKAEKKRFQVLRVACRTRSKISSIDKKWLNIA